MKILVCGGRTFGDLKNIVKLKDPELYATRLAQIKFVSKTLDELAVKYSKHYLEDDNWLPVDIVIIHGGARGADRCADEWGVVNFCKIHEFQAEWKKYGNAAGPIRNKLMLDATQPDLVVAFPGGSGTAGMVKLAKAASIETLEYAYDAG